MTFSPHTYLVLMCGGEGTRFAPLSTPERPKQFLRLFAERSLLQETLHRCATLLPAERVFVSTNHRYRDLVHEHLPTVPTENIVVEPCKKNTAPALALMAHCLVQQDPEAVMIVLPSDHMIAELAVFQQALLTAERLAIHEDLLVTLGIHPDRPAVEYGYIERGIPLSTTAFLVERFVEKPDHDRALTYLASGRYYWNSGMFIWKAARLLSEIVAHLPALHAALDHLPTTRRDYTTVDATVEAYFAAAPEISIDYGVMERSRCVATIPVDCGWSDVGSWEGLREFVDRAGLRVAPEVEPYLRQAG